MSKPKKIIEELIADLGKRFDRRFDAVDKQIEDLAAMTKRGFDEIGVRLDKIETRLDRIEFHMNSHERRIEVLEDRVRQISVKIGLRRTP